MQQQAISLLSLNELIKSTLDSHLAPTYWVIAEIGELRAGVRGHAYLDLIEKSEGNILAKIRGNIWSYTYQSISRKFESTTGTALKGGMNIMALVSVQFHELYGISLVVKDIDPNFTLGERARKRQEIISRLTNEGLIDLNRQYVLPKVSQKIAIISSVTAAGYGDFINQLDQNPQRYKIHYQLFQAAMQGKDAVPQIIQAIQQIEDLLMEEKFDLLVIVRGGGAQTDLDCFDDYELAKTIANASLPVVTGIGHERDESIADLVAHTQLKTPTAVASFILSGFREFEDSLHRNLVAIERRTQARLKAEESGLTDKTHLITNLFRQKLNESNLSLERYAQQARRISLYRTEKEYLKCEHLEQNLKKIIDRRLKQSEDKLLQYDKTIDRLNPQTLLQRGYTKTEKDGMPINKQKLKIGDELVTYNQLDKITSVINKLETNEKQKG
ncbi:exodeoxyribonuclease VII large subunit [Cyclobacterium qasimii]|uniref:Exodeoxyribonuclease 7 large subunit n=1 Tax=Cyclobacterium qasimii TaxID=1350429 RepID=A0A512CE74_9BACT|nr:exodeoxyribonuclease VII large subunit [Cyclobacterium qasimii]GEO22507.1 exodeoxyribonuclease 7 large subunit [Cyclobacterium qasimii]